MLKRNFYKPYLIIILLLLIPLLARIMKRLEIDRNMNKKDNLEHTIEKPVIIEGQEGEEFAVQCAECNKTIIFPTKPPICPSGCLERMDLCQHGVACQNCSKKLLLD
jgi:DNA-directed RNA polymerase subunit RPC12/RpoP